MSQFLVILHDAQDATPEGRISLQNAMGAKLGLSVEALNEMFSQLPVIVKENVPKERAVKYQGVLEALGGNVEVLEIEGAAEQTPTIDPDIEGRTVADLEEMMTALTDELPKEGTQKAEANTAEDSEVNSLLGDLESALGSLENEEESEQKADAQEDSLEDLEGMLDTLLDSDEESESAESSSLEAKEELKTQTESTESALSFSGEEEEKEEASTETKDSLSDLEGMLGSLLDSEEETESTGAVELEAAVESESSADSKEAAAISLNENGPSLSDLEGELDNMLSFEDDAEEIKEEAPSGLNLDSSTAETEAVEEDTQIAEDPAPALTLELALEDDEEEKKVEVQKEQEAGTEVDDSYVGELFDLSDEKLDEENTEVSASSAEDDSDIAEIAADLKGETSDGFGEETDESFWPIDEAEAHADKQLNASLSSAFGSKKEENDDSNLSESIAKAAALGNAALPSKMQLPVKIAAVCLVLLLAGLVALPALSSSEEESSLSFDPKQLQQILKEQRLAKLEEAKSRKAAKEEKERKAALPVEWTSTTKNELFSLEAELRTLRNDIQILKVYLETTQPEEPTDEELVEGIDRPWLRKYEAEGITMAEEVKRRLVKEDEKVTFLIAESPGRAYIDDLKGTSRIVAPLRIELRMLEGKLVGKFRLKAKNTNKASKSPLIKRLDDSRFDLLLNGDIEFTAKPAPVLKKSEPKAKKGKKKKKTAKS